VDMLTDKAWAGDELYQFVDDLTATKMNPYPMPNSVLVMDNCSTHHVPGIRELVESRCVALNIHGRKQKLIQFQRNAAGVPRRKKDALRGIERPSTFLHPLETVL
jgi:hypothetical protein